MLLASVGCSSKLIEAHDVQIKELVSAVLEDERQLTEDDIMMLFSARGVDFDIVCEAAGAHLPLACSRSSQKNCATSSFTLLPSWFFSAY